jgi:hypothetical protein
MATAADAELILKLYELRTEAGMREARNFVMGFSPASAEEMIALQRAMGSQKNAYWRQVVSYFEMAAAFVLRDALDPELFLDTINENFFYYAKFTPFFEEYAKAIGQPFMPKLTKLIEMYPAMQDRYTMMLARAQVRSKQEPQPEPRL